MLAIMADNDVERHVQVLLRICNSDEWHEVWASLSCDVESFEGLGTPRNTSDRELWQLCQRHDIVLITGNRNEEHAQSLETTIRELGAADSLPVLTIGDPTLLLSDRDYAGRAAVRLMEYLIDIQALRGAGRLYLP
jgi:hypothetical protein